MNLCTGRDYKYCAVKAFDSLLWGTQARTSFSSPKFSYLCAVYVSMVTRCCVSNDKVISSLSWSFQCWADGFNSSGEFSFTLRHINLWLLCFVFRVRWVQLWKYSLFRMRNKMSCCKSMPRFDPRHFREIGLNDICECGKVETLFSKDVLIYWSFIVNRQQLCSICVTLRSKHMAWKQLLALEQWRPPLSGLVERRYI